MRDTHNEERRRPTETDTRVAQSVEDLTSYDSLNVVSTSTHGVTDSVTSDGKEESVGTRPKIGNFGDERRSDAVENTVNDTDSTNDSVFTKRRGSKLGIYANASAFLRCW